MNLANRITILRLLLVPFFIACLIYYGEGREYLRFIALCIFSFACLTDALDGGVARSLGQATELGTILDPIADKMLIISAYVSLATIKDLPLNLHIPAWVVLTVLSRDVIILLGTVIIYFIKGKVLVKPSILGKLTTFMQMLAIMTLLLPFSYNKAVLYVAVLFTVSSGIDYIWRGSKQLNNIA